MSVLVRPDEAKSLGKSMNEEMNTATPAEQVIPAEQVPQDASIGSEPSAEQTQETEQQPEQKDEGQKKEPWFQKRIGELTREKYEARRAADDAARQVAQYQQYLEQIQQGQQPQPGEPPRVDIDALATQKATQLLQARQFDEQCNKVYSTGKTEFPDFDNAVGNLQMIGVSREFLELATTSDAGHKLLHHLGNDLDEASRILALPPVQMARELTRLEFKLSQPAIKPVSKAPAPIKPIGTGGASDSGLRDDLPIDEWMRRDRERKRSR